VEVRLAPRAKVPAVRLFVKVVLVADLDALEQAFVKCLAIGGNHIPDDERALRHRAAERFLEIVGEDCAGVRDEQRVEVRRTRREFLGHLDTGHNKNAKFGG